ncbi:replication-relaxation family protein, partial [Mycobacterium avium]
MRGNANEPRRDGPIAGQFASSNKPPLTSINGALMVGNDGAHTGTTAPKSRAKRRMNAPDVEELASRLSERDIAILGSIAEHQFLTAHQVEVLHFADLPAAGNRIARRTLARLRDHRLLGTLKRRIGGVRAGSGGLGHVPWSGV